MVLKTPHYRFELGSVTMTGSVENICNTLLTLTPDEMKKCRLYYLKPIKVWRWTFYRKVEEDVLTLLLKWATEGP